MNRNDYFSGEGHLNDEASALMADAIVRGRITDTPEQVLLHVEDCVECKDKIIDVVTILKNPDLDTDILAQNKKRKRSHYFSYSARTAAAAIFVVAALLLSVYLFLMGPSDINDRVFDSIDKGSTTHHSNQDPATNGTTGNINPSTGDKNPASIGNDPKTGESNETKNGNDKSSVYRVNPNLESMIGSQLRGSTFEALSPGNNTVLNAPIHFSWKKDLKVPHTLEIVNNTNKILHTYTVNGLSFDFIEKLKPGLYYWKLVIKNELVFVGKFFIGQPG